MNAVDAYPPPELATLIRVMAILQLSYCAYYLWRVATSGRVSFPLLDAELEVVLPGSRGIGLRHRSQRKIRFCPSSAGVAYVQSGSFLRNTGTRCSGARARHVHAFRICSLASDRYGLDAASGLVDNLPEAPQLGYADRIRGQR